MASCPGRGTRSFRPEPPFVQDLPTGFPLDLQTDRLVLLNFGSFVDNRIDFSRKTL